MPAAETLAEPLLGAEGDDLLASTAAYAVMSEGDEPAGPTGLASFTGAAGAAPGAPGKRHSASWVLTAAVVVANMVGAGALALPFVFQSMGPAAAACMLTLFASISTYSGLLLGWLRGDNSAIQSYADLALFATAQRFGVTAAKRVRRAVQVVFIAFLMGLCTIFLITMKVTLREMMQRCPAVYNSTVPAECERSACNETGGFADLPDSVWLLLAAIILYPIIHFRGLSTARWVPYVGALTITIVDIVVIVRSALALHAQQGAPASGPLVPSGPAPLTLIGFVNGATIIAFAFGGHAVMVDIMAEMRDPLEFPKSVFLSHGFMVVNYAVVGAVGYAAFGAAVEAPVTLNLPSDGLGVFTNVCLFVHVAVAYAISSIVIARNMVNTLWPGFLDSRQMSGHLKAVRWGFVSSFVLVLAYALAALVPFFGDMMAIISAIGIFTLSVGLPATLALLAHGISGLSRASAAVDVTLVVFSVAGVGLGLWAGIGDVIDKFQHCPVRFGE